MSDYGYIAKYLVFGNEDNPDFCVEMGIPILETVERCFYASNDEIAMQSAEAYKEHLISASSEYYGDIFKSVELPSVNRLEQIVVNKSLSI